jgi:hypothetical protein
MLLFNKPYYLGTKQQLRDYTQQGLPSIPAILMIDNVATNPISKNGKLTQT